uniref:Immunoglobulin domain-containing protein n=1 Tax=Spermophilus dauricus TaxID=99837 RepID=A0A8C9PIH9_SPEDA
GVPSAGSLLSPGLCLGQQVTAAQSGKCFSAGPVSLVPLERPVTIWCQGPPGVDLYRLEKLGSKKYEDQNFLSISAMKTSHAGRYRCSYQNGSQWSLPSDHLELVATGVFDKPSLTAHPSHVVLPGGGVTLKCQSQYGFDQFALYKEGDAGFYKRLEKQYLADFPMAPVTTAHSGTYRCYSFSNVSPYLWSSPSNPMVLTVTGKGCRPHSPSSVPCHRAGLEVLINFLFFY